MTRKPNPRVIHAVHPSSEWHTPARLRAVAHELLGPTIGLDPATDDRNRLHAARYFTRATNGLASEWTPANATPGSVWMNPPYGREIRLWTSLFIMHAGYWSTPHLALLPARVGARWYREITTAAQCVCELDGRVRFDLPSGEPAPDVARWGNVLVYFGIDRARAARVLSRFGAVRLVRPSPRTPRWLREQQRAERRGQLRLVE